MHGTDTAHEYPVSGGLFGSVKKSLYSYGIIRFLMSIPLILIYSVSYSILIPEYKTPFHLRYEQIARQSAAERERITTPAGLPSDLFYFSKAWPNIPGEDYPANTLILSAIEHLYKSLSFLKDIQDSDKADIKAMIHDKISRIEQSKYDESAEHQIYQSISSRGEYLSRLFEQLFTQHGLKKLGSKYSDTDVEIFFSMLLKSPYEKTFRRLLGALVMNIPYYLVIKNSINEYYQNNEILIPVDLFTITLFMMYLDMQKSSETRPTIEECRRWVFSVIVPDDKKGYNPGSKNFSVQPVIREEMIMPNPGYFSKAYHPVKHRAIDIASERGTMIRSPVTGTVNYYEKSPKIDRTGNFIIIKDNRSYFNIFICHMDSKDYIEEHSTEGELAEPIANLSPDWTHPLKKGQFFQVVGNLGKSTGAHTHIQIARRIKPYDTFDFLSVNKPFRKKFNSYLHKNGYWHIYSRNEQLLLSLLSMTVGKYGSSRHFSDKDPSVLALYSRLQKDYTPASVTVNKEDTSFEQIPENILHTYFSRTMQEQTIEERYVKQLKYNANMAKHYSYMLKLTVPLSGTLPRKAVPVTPWMIFRRRENEKKNRAR